MERLATPKMQLQNTTCNISLRPRKDIILTTREGPMARKRRDAPEGALLRRTRELLAERKGALHDVSMATGLTVNWLHNLASGVSRDPSVNRVEAVYSALTGRGLDV